MLYLLNEGEYARGSCFHYSIHFSLANVGSFLSYMRPLTRVNKCDSASFHGFFFQPCFSVYSKAEIMLNFSDPYCPTSNRKCNCLSEIKMLY